MTTSNGEAVLPSIDSNILVRALVKDPPEQYAASARLVATLALGVEMTVENVVIAEVVWTLKSFYGWTRPRIAEELSAIIDLPGVRNTDKPTLRHALALYGSRTIDFADALLAARALRHGGAVVSFDRDFDRIAGLRRIQPA